VGLRVRMSSWPRRCLRRSLRRQLWGFGWPAR